MKKLMNVLILAGVLLIWGTAGASDAESISFMTALRQALYGVALIFVGVYGKILIEKAKSVSHKAEIIKFKSKNAA